MSKKEDFKLGTTANEPQGSTAKAIKSPTFVVSPKATRITRAKRYKKAVKFADPLTEQRLYQNPVSPKDEIEQQLRDAKIQKASTKPKSTLGELEPPLSLVAQLDLAAKKLNARPDSRLLAASSIKSLKSSKSTKSTRSIGETLREAKSPIDRDKG